MNFQIILNFGGFSITVSFDRVAEIYDKTRSLPFDVMRKLVRTMTNELDGCQTILDLGVGTGRFAKPLQDAGFKIVGIDISRKMVSKAKEKCVSNLILGDARFLPYRDNVFDATISIHLLHLIGEWKKALGEVCRVTRLFMFSLSYTKKDPVRETYDRLLKQCGYERRRPGKSEQELMDLAKSKSVKVSTYDTFADDRLINLAQGTSSSQWEIPENINREIVDKLRSQFAGKMFSQELQLAVWKIDDLRLIANVSNRPKET